MRQVLVFAPCSPSESQPRWAQSWPAWRLLASQAGWVGMAGALSAMVTAAVATSWVRVVQLSALTALYNGLTEGPSAASGALPWYLATCGLSTSLYLVREGGSIALELWTRRLLTVGSLEQYLQERGYLLIKRRDEIDHPDQRIAEDAAEMARQTMVLGLSLFSECAALLSFLVVLHGAGTPLLQSRFGEALGSVGISPLMILPILALCTAAACTLGGLWLGRRLASFEHQREQAEASFRRDLLVLREQSEQVASMWEEGPRRAGLRRLFAEVMRQQSRWLFARLRLEAFRVTERDLSKLLPLALIGWAAIPQLSLGHVIKIVGAFVAVAESGQWLVKHLASVRTLKAASWRLGTFLARLRELVRRARESDHVDLADDHPLRYDLIHWAAQVALLPEDSNQWVLLRGASGSGKSSLLRTLQGKLPQAVLVPQSLKLCDGTLQELCDPTGICSLEELERHLCLLGMSYLIGDLQTRRSWGQVLSGGEQQRLAVLRAVLQRPLWLLLDEPLASLDDISGRTLVQWLKQHAQSRVVLASHTVAGEGEFDWSATLHEGTLLIAPGAELIAAGPS